MDEQLIAAIEATDLRRVEELLAAGANPNACKDGTTAYQRVPHGADEIKCALIEAGAEDSEIRHALVWIVNTGRIETVRAAIAKGADVNVDTCLGPPIQVAAGDGRKDIVELLVAAGADVDADGGISTPLLNALERGHAEIALSLVAAGADPNRTSGFGRTQPLAMAAALGSVEVIRALIAAGAEVNANVPHITLNRLVVQQEAASSLQSAFGAMEALGRVMESLEDLEDEEDVSSDRMTEIQNEMTEIETVAARDRTRATEPENAIDTSPLLIAARCGHADAIAPLLEAGADPHRKDGEGQSAYDWAVRNQDSEVLAVLERFGITETRFDPDEKLVLAAESSNLATVRESLAEGANANARDTRRQTRHKTALMLAARAGHLTVVQALLEAGADPDATDREAETQPVSRSLLEHTDPKTILSMGYTLGRTALFEAAGVGQTEVVRHLLQAGANPNARDDVGGTPLVLAAENRHLATIRVLVDAGAEVDRAATYGNTPLMLACEKGAVEVAAFLLSRGADPNQTNRDRETALMKAASVGSLPLVRLLIERGADVNGVSADMPETALSLAVGASHYVAVDRGDSRSSSSIRQYRDDGCWELQPLPEPQILEIVQTLLDAGADPNLPDCYTTPLIEAAWNGNLQVLQLLLALGARLEVRDRDGDTAVSMAKLYRQEEILTFLRDYTNIDSGEFECREPEDEDAEDEDERWGEDLPQPDFSEVAGDPNYQQAVDELAEMCGSSPVGDDDFPGWFSVHVNSKRRETLDTEEVQRRFLEKGYFVYEPKSSFRTGPQKLCIIPTADKYDAIALHQTNGCNYGVGPGYVVQWLKDLERRQPFVLTCIAHDTLEGRFLSPIEDAEGLAEQMYEFCPDIVDQGCDSVELLAEHLTSSEQLSFWWD